MWGKQIMAVLKVNILWKAIEREAFLIKNWPIFVMMYNECSMFCACNRFF